MASYGLMDLGEDYFRQKNLNDYRWIFAIDVIIAWFAAYGIGANDVANSFGSSVGAKAITMRQAVVIASIFEFCGAFFLGASVTGTIKGGIAKGEAFRREPELLMYGFLCVDIAIAVWLALATYLELPVSTTHTAVGAVIGMSMVLKGADSVFWKTTSDDFPYLGGVAMIVVSWVTSPVLCSIAAGLIFFLVRTFVLRSTNAFDRSFYALPVIMAITIAVNLIFLIKKGAKGQGSKDLGTEKEQIIAWVTGAGCGIIILFFMPLLKRKILRDKEKAEADAAAAADNTGDFMKEKDDAAKEGSEDEESTESSWFRKFLKKTIDRDVHAEASKIEKVSVIHEHAEKFDPYAEETFKYLQVFTACCAALAHGANDVANAVGPLAAIAQIYRTGTFSSKVDVQRWVLAVGGTGIVVGLALYGYNIIRAIGLKLSRITSSRGFAIELGASIVVIIASNYGLPVSTTHCQVGATIGVGALEGVGGVHWLLFLKMIGGWLITLVVAGGVAAVFTALGAYVPSAQMAEQIRHYEDGIRIRGQALAFASSWEATAAANGTVEPPFYNEDGDYIRPAIPAFPEEGVPVFKTFRQWKDELLEDAGVFSKAASWDEAWLDGLGDPEDSAAGLNTSTVPWEKVLGLYDLISLSQFSEEQQTDLLDIIEGRKFLCCEEEYKCCERKCDYTKAVDDCEGKCAPVDDAPDDGCVEESCDDDDLESKTISSKNCVIVESKDDCPLTAVPGTKNYASEEYLSNPITAAEVVDGVLQQEQSAYTDWREPAVLTPNPLCPIDF